MCPRGGPAFLGHAIGITGIAALSVPHGDLTWKAPSTSLFEKPTLIGLLCGAFLGASVVFYWGAALVLGDGEAVMRVAFALAVSLVIQIVLMGGYLRLREPGQMTAVLLHRRPAVGVGVAGFLASVGWFTALAPRNAATVRAVGQIEPVFTFVASVVFFEERSTRMERLGIVLILGASRPFV